VSTLSIAIHISDGSEFFNHFFAGNSVTLVMQMQTQRNWSRQIVGRCGSFGSFSSHCSFPFLLLLLSYLVHGCVPCIAQAFRFVPVPPSPKALATT
jgi:hypothetical protein